MTRRRASTDTRQIGFSFETPEPAREPGDLAGLGRRVSAAVGKALKDDPRSRTVIAAEMTALLDEEITPFMLDGYASEARETHSISAHRWMALIAVTDRLDLYDQLSREIGASVLVGPELEAAHLGHLRSRIKQLQEEERRVAARLPTIVRGSGR